MSKKTIRSQDAARTTSAKAGTAVKHSGPTEKAKREVRKTIAANIARIEKDEARVANGEQSGQPQQPQQDQQQHASPELAPAAPTGSAPAQPAPEAPASEARPAKRGAKAKPAKPVKPAKPAKEPKAKKMSCIDAAAQVLAANKGPMSAKDMIAEMKVQNLWTSPNGKTPEASLYAAIIREIAADPDDARFKKVDRGLFVIVPRPEK